MQSVTHFAFFDGTHISICIHDYVNLYFSIRWQSDDVVPKLTGSLYYCCAPMLHGARQVKREPVDLVMEDYAVSLCQQIVLYEMETRSKLKLEPSNKLVSYRSVKRGILSYAALFCVCFKELNKFLFCN